MPPVTQLFRARSKASSQHRQDQSKAATTLQTARMEDKGIFMGSDEVE